LPFLAGPHVLGFGFRARVAGQVEVLGIVAGAAQFGARVEPRPDLFPEGPLFRRLFEVHDPPRPTWHQYHALSARF
jgi:hypothetical protein